MAVESYASGFIVADYTGKRGKFGAAYCGSDGEWRSQAVGMTPFSTREQAEKFEAENVKP